MYGIAFGLSVRLSLPVVLTQAGIHCVSRVPRAMAASVVPLASIRPWHRYFAFFGGWIAHVTLRYVLILQAKTGGEA